MAAKKTTGKAARADIPTPPSCLLYGVSPPRIDDLGAFADALEAALEAGLGVFQLRLKEADDACLQAATERLLPLCHAREIPFILNDRPELAAAWGCDGVHLGQEDLAATRFDTVRRQMGDRAVIGITAHASKHLAMEAGEQGADYVAFGAFFPTRSKPQAKIDQWGVPEVSLLTEWSTFASVPCVAIGGVTPENCLSLITAGADFIAAITGIWQHPQGAAAAVTAFREQISQGVAERTAALAATA